MTGRKYESGHEATKIKNDTPMKHTPLARIVSLAWLTLGFATTSMAETPLENPLRDQLDAVTPAHLEIDMLNQRLVGEPPVKAKLEIAFRAAETLYTSNVLEAQVKAVPSELTDDLRARQPKPLQILRVTLAEGAVSKTMMLDAQVSRTPAGLQLGRIDANKFRSLGRPRSDFDAGLLTEDSPEGRRRIADWEREVAEFNLALKRHDRRVGAQVVKNVVEGVADGVSGLIKLFPSKLRREPAATTKAPVHLAKPESGEGGEAKGGDLESGGSDSLPKIAKASLRREPKPGNAD